jgi:predicted ATPase with chaperone activity
MTVAIEVAASPYLAAPTTLADAGLSQDLVSQLALKMLHTGSESTGLQLARRLGLEYSVIEPCLDSLKRSRHVEVSSGLSFGGPSFCYRITDEGRRRAILLFEQSQYVGVAPVPLAQYQRYMERYGRALPRTVTRTRVREAFSHLVVSQKVLDQLGPAVAAGHSLFIYGPPGNGKTVISQAIRNLLDGEIDIPHALEVEGQIITFFDPVNHEPLAVAEPASDLITSEGRDERWIRCRRPLVTVGGELTLSALDLTYSPLMGFYTAPVHARANGGVLVIDDFGRQHCSAQDLLNRWIVPLESRIDYLTLQTGQKFQMPFQLLVVFATNLKPADLVDEAFMRRIHYKVLAESPTPDEFLRIFRDCCAQEHLTFDGTLAARLMDTYLRPKGIALRGCHPRDLIKYALAHAEYRDEPRELTYSLLEAACDNYFVDGMQ